MSTCESQRIEHIDSVAHFRVIVDSNRSEVVDDLCPIALVVACEKHGAVARIVREPHEETKASFPTGRLFAPVRHVGPEVGVACCSVLGPGREPNLAEKKDNATTAARSISRISAVQQGPPGAVLCLYRHTSSWPASGG